MTKEEIIKEAWIKYWKLLTKEDKKYILSNNGYLWKDNDCIYEHEDIDNDMDFKAGNGLRPYSLEGIEHNNGWIKIESEDDLPKDYIECYFISVYNNTISAGFYSKSDNKFFSAEYYEVREVTHYQQIEKPNPPIY